MTKDGEKVKIIYHKGTRLDFYKLCPKKVHNEMSELLKKIGDKMKLGKVKQTTDIAVAIEKLQSWMETVFPNGCHYADVPAIATYAKGHGIDYFETKQKIKAHYAGEHIKDAVRWLRKIYMR